MGKIFYQKYLAIDNLEQYTKRFAIVNRLFYKWPVKVDFVKKNDRIDCDLLKISEKNDSIYVGRPSRVKLYKNGVKNRRNLLLNEYLVNHIIFQQNDIIIDCGANVGEFTQSLQQSFGIKAICFEPEAIEYQALLKNTDAQKTHIYKKALWKNSGSLSFYPANNSGDSSLFAIKKSEQPVIVEATTLQESLMNDSFFLENGCIKLLKLEAEGAEPEILEGAQGVIEKIEYVTADCGPERGMAQDNTVVEVLRKMKDYGFEPIKFGLPRVVILFKNLRF